MKNLKSYFKAISILSGLIIGAGIFALPWQAANNTFFVFLVFLAFILPILISLHLIYSEIILATPETHRFIGYVNYYYGKVAKMFIAFVMLVVFLGSLLAYLVLSTKFLVFIFPNLSYSLAGVISFLICAIPAYFELKKVSFLEMLSIVIIILISLFLFFLGKENISKNLFYFKPANFSLFLSLYGVLLYSLYGLSAIPELISAVGKESKKVIKKSIIIGTILPAFVYLFFVISFFKIFPLKNISPEAINSFANVKGNFHFLAIILGGFGFLAVITSFWVLGSNLKNSFYFDFGIKKTYSWLLAVFIPFGFYLLGVKNFVKIISFVGAFGLGLEAIIMIFLYKKIKKQVKKEKISFLKNIFLWGIVLVFFVGVILSLIFK